MIEFDSSISDSYRPLIKQFQADNIVHHTHQLRGERTYSVVLRHLHNSINTDVIKSELEVLGHRARSVFNIRHSLVMAPLLLYFVNLEPYYNKNIFDLHFLCNMTITIEATRKKDSIVQCTRWQTWGILKLIAPDCLSVINMAVAMIRQSEQKNPFPRRLAPFLVGNIS